MTAKFTFLATGLDLISFFMFEISLIEVIVAKPLYQPSLLIVVNKSSYIEEN
jgi:hypothetical protein